MLIGGADHNRVTDRSELKIDVIGQQKDNTSADPLKNEHDQKRNRVDNVFAKQRNNEIHDQIGQQRREQKRKEQLPLPERSDIQTVIHVCR